MATRKEIIEFLTTHYRYSTMNSWNGLHSYAVNVKLLNLKFPSKEVEDRAYEMLETEEAFDGVNMVPEEFARAHNWEYQIGFNGRSGGYMVLYTGGRKLSGHKSYCTSCGQRNFTRVEDTGKQCGVCSKKTRVNREFFETFTNSRGIGSKDPLDYADMDIESIRAEYKVVREFDKTVKDACAEFIATAEGNEVIEETVMVPKKVKRLAERG